MNGIKYEIGTGEEEGIKINKEFSIFIIGLKTQNTVGKMLAIQTQGLEFRATPVMCVMTYPCNPSTGKAETGKSLGLVG